MNRIRIGRAVEAYLTIAKQLYDHHAFVVARKCSTRDNFVVRWTRFRSLICHRLGAALRSEEHTSELQSLMRISYAVFCLKKKIKLKANTTQNITQECTYTVSINNH